MPSPEPYKDEIARKRQEKIDQRGRRAFPALKKGKPGGGVVTNHVADALLAKDPYEIKMAIAYMNNFVFSCTGVQRWEAALSGLPFLVHITTHASEMTQFADIVLPATTSGFEKWGYLKGKTNRMAYVSLTRPVIEPLGDVKTDETAIPWLIAEKLAEKGFSNLLDYYRKELKDPETGRSPSSASEFEVCSLKYCTSPVWDGKVLPRGERIEGWKAFLTRGIWNAGPYPYRKRWGKFNTVTKKFEFYSETLKRALTAHAENHETTTDDISETCKYEARGDLAFVPHYETPYRVGDPGQYPFTFVDYKSGLNHEGRSANTSWYMDFKKMDVGDESGQDVLKINPGDARRLGIKAGDTVRVTSPLGSFLMTARPWEGIGPGVVTKCYGQGHWAYGRIASADYRRAIPRGVNNNELIPAEYDRLSGSTARNGGVTRVRIETASSDGR